MNTNTMMKKNSSAHKRPSREKWWYFPSIAVSFFFFAVFFSALGFHFSGYQQSRQDVDHFRQVLGEQRSMIEIARIKVRADLDAFTQRIGLLQAHINRINALGTKMLAMAGVKEDEFDFTSVPAMGGAADSIERVGYGNEEISLVLNELEASLIEKEQQLNILDEMMLAKDLQDEVKPSGMPVDQGWMSSRYGYRSDPFTGKRQFHAGIDFAGAEGTPNFSAASGIVVRVSKQPDFGLMIEVDHRNGYVTRYAHTSEVLVKEGDIVKQGQVIAKIGNTGRSTGPHLHFEVKMNGKSINPSKLLEAKEGLAIHTY
jgi:murein DD-endopeptidase MepM/ murein hydrolase activator NlpD